MSYLWCLRVNKVMRYMLSCLSLHMRINETHVWDVSVIVREASWFLRIFGRDSNSVESFYNLLSSLAIAQSKLNASRSHTLISQSIDVSSSIHNVPYSSNFLKFLNLGFLGKSFEIELYYFSRLFFSLVSIIKPRSVKHCCLHLLLFSDSWLGPWQSVSMILINRAGSSDYLLV